MFYVEIRAYAPTASFRIPEYHTYQQTLPLPPMTTLTGILGAAAGFDFQQAMTYKKENELYVGVWGYHTGQYKDLWKYQKIKDKEVVSAVLTREYIYDLKLNIYFFCYKKDVIKNIKNWFSNPRYALTAGSSDDLLKIKYISEIRQKELCPIRNFSNTIIPGNHSKNYKSDIKIEEMPLMRDVYLPQVYLLPSDFTFTGSERRTKERKPYTFVDTPIRLEKPLEGLIIDNREIALL
ncbi:MAG TPA: CRISPR-associated protein Cas5 [Clostridiales bacterium]|nr:CRISPR-associated protein Cas5 [Clostridiales bacterium]